MIRKVIGCLLLCWAISAQAAASSLDDGVAALGRSDYSQALELLAPLAAEGNAAAEFYLGKMYAGGLGVTVNFVKAATLFQAGVDKGFARSFLALGALYQSGSGVPKNVYQAIKLYKTAAGKGLAEASLELGRLYEFGDGIPANAATAVGWYQKAASLGEKRASTALDRLAAAQRNGGAVSGSDSAGIDEPEAPTKVGEATPQMEPLGPPKAPAPESGEIGREPSTQAARASLGRRVALVIGNSSYPAVGELANPRRDAELIANALKADGFEITRADDLNRAAFIATLNRFSETARSADWAMIYFAGHGLQLDGLNYIIPVDATLEADRDVQDEAIPLDRVIAAVRDVRKFGLVVLDACRNNPFLADMHFTGAGRAARTRGLARVEPQGTILVEFSARDGQVALDGDLTANSPFAAALAKRLTTPGVEVGKLLRQVREDVLAATDSKQEPMFSGNIPAEDLFFRLPQ